MSRARLPEADYAAAISEAEAHLREHLPKAGDRSMTWTMARVRFYFTTLFEAEAQKTRPEPVMSWPDSQEKFCRKLIAHAEDGDKQADADLRMLAIDFFDAAIKGGNDVAAPRALLRYVRDLLEGSLPRDKQRLRARQIAIAAAVDLVLKKLPKIRPTRNETSRTAKHPESACSLVAAALANVKPAMGENNVQKVWESHGIFSELIRSKKLSKE